MGMTSSLLLLGALCLLLPLCTKAGLPLGSSCFGDKKDLCEPPTVCENGRCVSTVGGPCSSYSDCLGNMDCESPKQKCVLGFYEDCTNHTDMCRQSLRCDASFTCRRRNGSYCTSNAFFECPAGASCLNVPNSRYRNYCFCTQGVSVEEDSTCKPLDGKVLGACTNGTTCDDPYAVCNTTTGKCECGPGTTIEPETLTCRLKAGQSCKGADKKKLCGYGTFCADDKICRVMGGRDCSGEKRELCESGYICPVGYERCYGDFGTLIKRNNAYCRPGASKDYDKFCWISVGQDCKDNKDLCYSRVRGVPGVCDPPTNTCKVLINSSWCTQDQDCPAGARCTNRKCQCLFSGESFAKHQDRLCGLPKGRVGAQCGTADDPNGCEGYGVECREKTGYCACKKGFTENINSATCFLSGPKCTLHGYGVINTFYGKPMDLILPCRFRMAKFKCGKAKVDVFANRNKSLVEELTIILQVGDSEFLYKQTADKILKENPWKSKCLSDQCDPDSVIQLNVSSNRAVLERGLLRISYNRTSVHIECGHNKFTGRDSYPDALCGSPSDTYDTVKNYIFDMRIAGGRQPDGFRWAWMWERAFYSRRVNDRAILYNQKVPQSNPMCTEISEIVSTTCPGRVENMYNCSHLIDNAVFDESWSDLLTYKECFGSNSIDPLKVYAACLSVMCSRNTNATDVSEATCNTLTQAADLCESKVGRTASGYAAYLDPYMSLSHLLGRHASQCRDQD